MIRYLSNVVLSFLSGVSETWFTQAGLMPAEVLVLPEIEH